MKRTCNTSQLMNRYRSVMNRVLDTDYSTKASVLKMRMISDGVDMAIADSMVKTLIDENATAVNSVR